MQEEQFKFSVIMPVYNTGIYLEEAIESVLFQSIGYRENIELILVDDGSTDDSPGICDEYARRYPRNVRAVHQPNGGVSAARNKGIEMATGKYVAFVDSDDKISCNAMEEVYRFFEQNRDAIDLVSIPLRFFDAKEGYHIQHYKFEKGTRVIDLRKDYTCLQTAIGGLFVKNEIMKGYKLNTKMSIFEDAELISKMLMENPRYGVVTNVTYFYRRRSEGEASLSTELVRCKYYYSFSLKNFALFTAQYAIKKFGYVPRFVQFTIMNYLQWLCGIDPEIVKTVLTEEEVKEYLALFYEALKYIDDEIILAQKVIQIEEKAFLIAKRNNVKAKLKITEDERIPYSSLGRENGGKPQNILEHFRAMVTVNGHNILELNRSKNELEFIKIKDDVLTIEGYATFIGIDEFEDLKIYLAIDDETFFPCAINYRRDNSKKRLGETVLPSITYCGEIKNISRYGTFCLKIYTELQGLRMERMDMRFGKFFPLGKKLKREYAWIGKWMVRARDNRLEFSVPTNEQVIFQEESLLREIAFMKSPEAMHATGRRRMYHLQKAQQERPVWIMCDRVNKGGDSGEALFQYVCREQGERQDSYFVLRQDSSDWPIVSEYGKVLDYYSDEHLMAHLLSDVVISGHFDEHVRNPFFQEIAFYRDILYHKQQVHLTHGVLKDDLTRWVNRYMRDFALFTLSSQREIDELRTQDYFYDDSVLKLTGLTRFDPLVKGAEKREIVIAPSWRSYLTREANSYIDGIRKAVDHFRESEYFQFYNGLINDQRLLDHAKECGYTISFMPHPNIIPFIDMFDRHEGVTFYSIDKRYFEMLSDASLMVTDYSGISFDFAYLDKPVIYCLFDVEEMYSRHTFRRGYWEYERDGFGEVEYNLEDTVRRIMEYMDNGCRLKEKYRERIDNFFAFRDHRNSERVYREIVNMSALGDMEQEQEHSRILSDKQAWLDTMEKVRSLPKDPKGVLLYVFPYDLFSEQDRVVLYGFGAIGRTFYWQNRQFRFCEVVACIDENASGEEGPSVPFMGIQDLCDLDYDYVLIAITSPKVADSVRKKLMDCGVKAELIKWAGEAYECRVKESEI